MFNRILMVCVGNVCRSPTAEFVLRSRLQNQAIAVESAGLGALTGNPIDPLAESVLAEHGLTGETHIARGITPQLINAADLVLVMEKEHVRAVHAMEPLAIGKTFLLGKWHGDVDIPDPYRQRRAAFKDAYWIIERAVNSWYPHL